MYLREIANCEFEMWDVRCEIDLRQTGNPPERWDSRRSAEKRSQPCGHDLVIGWLYATGRKSAQELSPKAEALFPGRRLPAREKSPSLCPLCLCGEIS